MSQTEAQKRAQKNYVFKQENHWRYKRNYRMWYVKNLKAHREKMRKRMKELYAIKKEKYENKN